MQQLTNTSHDAAVSHIFLKSIKATRDESPSLRRDSATMATDKICSIVPLPSLKAFCVSSSSSSQSDILALII